MKGRGGDLLPEQLDGNNIHSDFLYVILPVASFDCKVAAMRSVRRGLSGPFPAFLPSLLCLLCFPTRLAFQLSGRALAPSPRTVSPRVHAAAGDHVAKRSSAGQKLLIFELIPAELRVTRCCIWSTPALPFLPSHAFTSDRAEHPPHSHTQR